MANPSEDQDAIAAQWEASLDSEDPAEAAAAAAANELSGSMALQWAAMVEDGSRDFGTGKNNGERGLSQEEIDNLLGFSVGDVNLDDNSGIRAIIDSAMVSYERLPMLEIVFDRLVRLMTTSLRNFTSDNGEVSLDRITSVRFGDYMNSIPLPAVLCVFKAEEWENFGLATVDSSLIYSMIDVLLGGRRGQTSLRIEGRPYTTIETNLVKRLVEVVLADAEQAFRPLSPVTFSIDRLETNPRFAAIRRPAHPAAPPPPPPWFACASTWKIAAAMSSCCCPMPPSSRSAACCCRCSWARNSAATRSGKAISPPKWRRRRSRSMPC